MSKGNEREGWLRPRAAQGVVPREIGIPEEARDDVLLRRAAKGDEDAFTVLYRRHQAAIYRFALRMTGNAWASEEIVQDVFMTLMREPKKYDVERGALAAYLYGIARNRVMKHLERLPREVALDEHNENGSRGGAAVDQCGDADALGRTAGAHAAGARRGSGSAAGISRGGRALRTGRTELRGSVAANRVPHWNDSLAVASRTCAVAGEAGNVAGRAAAFQRGPIGKGQGS